MELLNKLSQAHLLCVSILTQMELIQGCRNKAEQKECQDFLVPFETLIPTPDELKYAVDLLIRYRLQHGLTPPDAIVAATAQVRQLPLLTFNRKHFRFIDGLTLLEV